VLIKHFFAGRIEACISAGISESKLILDPGFGFGKTYEHNLSVLSPLIFSLYFLLNIKTILH
jgi:dihydropteroate synthase